MHTSRTIAVLAAMQFAPPLAAQDECTTATPVVDGTNGPFTNAGSTTSFGWPCGAGDNDVWFAYIASGTGSLFASTCSPRRNFDTVIEVFDGTGGCSTLVSLACNDDNCAQGSTVNVGVTQGQPIFVRVGGFGGVTGVFDVVLTLVPATFLNEECAGALPLNLGVNPGFNNNGASTSAPPWPCNGANDLWYTYAATLTAPHTFETCSSATTLDTTLEVFAGGCGALVSLGCNDDTCGLQSRVVANLIQGSTYHVRVGGYAGNVGAFDLIVALGTSTGTIASLGGGCGPTTFVVSGNPNLGGTISAALGSLSGLPFVGLGFVGASTPFCSCSVGHEWAATNFTPSLSFGIPGNGSLVGLVLYIQGADLLGTGGCPSPPVTLTDTWQVVIG
jgi:hypothetical protein